jgi:cytochrome c2
MKTISFTRVLAILAVLLTIALLGDAFLRERARVPEDARWHLVGADVERGRRALEARGCGACHVIPGVKAASGRVGPSLARFRQQIYVAGKLPNVPSELVAWIREPERYSPGTAMPNLGIPESEARDIAAYLYQIP